MHVWEGKNREKEGAGVGGEKEVQVWEGKTNTGVRWEEGAGVETSKTTGNGTVILSPTFSRPRAIAISTLLPCATQGR